MMTTGHILGEAPGQSGGETQSGAADDAQNAPDASGAAGAPSEQEVDYLRSTDSKDDVPSPTPEDPRRHGTRPKRCRRLLAIGGVPIALITITSLQLGSIFLISLAGNRAATAGHYDTALSRYRTVARINSWLEQWRVHLNLDTGQPVTRDPTSAVTTLSQIPSEAPRVKIDSETKMKETDPPEYMMRTNLYVTHLILTAQVQKSESSAAVIEHIEAARKAADACGVPPPLERNPSLGSTPSATPSSNSSSNPSSQPSSNPSSTPSATPNSDPSSNASSQSSNDPSSNPSSLSSSGETSSSTPSAKPTPTPVDDRARRPRDRSNGSPGTVEESGDSEEGGKP